MPVVRAAGAVLWRSALPAPGPADGAENPDPTVQICLVHRPRYDDWSLPKGKLDPDEHPLVAAVREVREETGVHARPQALLPQVSYPLPDGTAKTVDFWLMRAAPGPAGRIEDPDEVDRLEWLSPADAMARLSYADEVRTVEHAVALPPVTAVTLLVRHARAGERKKWSGPDGIRPLDPKGWTQAAGLAEVLALAEPVRLFAATPLRCKQTLEPLSEKTGLPIVTDPAFAEPAGRDELPARVTAAAARLVELRGPEPVVFCSQGKLIPALLAALTGGTDPMPYKTPKGGGWVLSWSGDDLVALSRL